MLEASAVVRLSVIIPAFNEEASTSSWLAIWGWVSTKTRTFA
jgi:hypothetical protein